MSLASPLYWIVVVAATAAFGLVVVTVMSGHENLRFYRAAVAVYVVGWGLEGSFGGVGLLSGIRVGPQWGALWAALPVETVAGTVVFFGGHILAGVYVLVYGLEQVLAHPELRTLRKRVSPPAQVLTQAQLSAAEAYDAKWQAEDRQRNRRLGTGPKF